jgi:hypothetical protein
MGIIKDIKETRKIVEEMHNANTKIINEKARKYDELISYLKNINFNIDKIIPAVDDLGNTKYAITYKSPTIIQEFDETGKPIKNNFIYSINMLDLVSVEDWKKLQDIYELEKQKNKKS